MASLEKAIALSQEIELAISEYDLEKIAQLDRERQNVINQYFSEQKHIDEKLTLKLKEMNDSIVARLVELQRHTRSRQVEIKQASKITQAYQNNLPK